MSDVSINALDDMSSLLWVNNNGNAAEGFSYSPFGGAPARNADNAILLGFNGERLDPLSQAYHLGNGYRTYKSKLMRFTGPDSWSPFGSGGLNQYAYCEGDPINRSDPNGHMSSGAIAGIIGTIVGVAGAILAIATLGSSIAALLAAETVTVSLTGEALASVIGAGAAATGIASNATEKSDPSLSKKLGWASLGLGIISFGTTAIDNLHSRYLKKDSVRDISNAGGRRNSSVNQWRINSSGDRQLSWGEANYAVSSPITGVYTYSDYGHDGGSRLNIVVDGEFDFNGPSMMHYGGNGGKGNIVHLANTLSKHGIDFEKYTSFCLVSSNGADGFFKTSGGVLSEMLGKPVIAFSGEVVGDTVQSLVECHAWHREARNMRPAQRKILENVPGINSQAVFFSEGFPVPRKLQRMGGF